MVATEQNVGGEKEPYFEGDSLKLTFSISTVSGNDKDLSTATATWKVESDTETVLTDSDSGVTTVVDDANSEITISLSSGVTDGMAGIYDHYLRIDDGSDTVTVTIGDFVIDTR